MEAARRLRDALVAAGVPTFLDETDLDAGEQLPMGIVDGLFGATAVVAFADEAYYTRWYCLRELHIALAAFNALVRRGGSEQDKSEALLPVVIVVPAAGAHLQELERLPPRLKTTLWWSTDEVHAVVRLVVDRLAEVPVTIGERLMRLGELIPLRATVTEEAAIPPARSLSGIPSFALVGELRPSIQADFVGRSDELWRIHHTLSTMRGDLSAAALTGAIEGGGGFGKTRLATEYLHRFGPTTYPGGLFWINAEQSLRLEEQLHGVLVTLRPEVPRFTEFSQAGRDAARELAQALRALPRERPVLYVVDNIPEPEAGHPPKDLSTWCPAVGSVTLLVTSRARQSIQAGIASLPVDVLAPRSAVALLTQSYENRSRLLEQEWFAIAAWVGYLPLALELLNASLVASATEPEELADMARAHSPLKALDAAAETLRGVVPAGAMRGISEAFEVSYRRLPPEARRAARLLACYAAAAIPLTLFQALGEEVATPAVKMLLSTRSFVGAAPTSDLRIPLLGRIHSVLAEFLRARSGDPEVDLRAACKGLLALMTPDACQDPSKWGLMNSCLPHARALFEATASLAGTAELAVDLGNNLGLLLQAQGFFYPAEAIESRVVDLARESLGGEHPDTLTSMNNLGLTLRSLGDLVTARSLHEAVLEAHRRLLGDEHPETLTSMNNLALTLRSLGDLVRARSLHEAVLETRRRILGDEHPDTLASMGNLATTLFGLGDLTGARSLEEVVLETRRRLRGSEHPETLFSMANLAAILCGLGELGEARSLDKSVLEVRRRILGDEHPDTLTSMNNLALTLFAFGDLGGARKLQESVLETRRRILGDEHPDTLGSMKQSRRDSPRPWGPGGGPQPP
jgi:tetratricopeptide (TPR) repeat protein